MLPVARSAVIAVIVGSGASAAAFAQPADALTPRAFSVEIDTDGPLLRGKPQTLVVRALGEDGALLSSFEGRARVTGLERSSPPHDPIETIGPFRQGVVTVQDVLVPDGRVRVTLGEAAGELKRTTFSPWLTLLPPLIAIALALSTRQVLLSLFCGLWAGVTLLEGWNPFTAFLRSIDTYVIGALADADHAHIILFSLTMAGMVGILHYNGGIHGIVTVISRLARTPRGGQCATWFLGTLIFFDDYANSLIVGNTMRPFTDRLRISREKLSFIVDSTAAPVATIGIISTWTAYQLGLLQDVLLRVDESESSAYLYFLGSIPVSFYSILMLFFVLLVGVSLRDFGPMRRAEERARQTGQVLRPGAQPLMDDSVAKNAPEGVEGKWWNAAVPIVLLIAFTVVGLVATGLAAIEEDSGATLKEIIGNADAYRSLLWASVGASIVAASLSLAQRRALADVVTSWVDGARSLQLAVMILLLAWALSSVCGDLRTGAAVAWLVPDVLRPQLVPVLAFLTAGVIAFSTGTSYGTMGILIPILLPLVYELATREKLEPDVARAIGQTTLAAILGGAVFGDHCSPISDTTVLSSMASGADHIDHVRTQLPYAVTVASFCVPAYVLAGYGVDSALILVAGGAGLIVTISLLGRTRGQNAGIFEESVKEPHES